MIPEDALKHLILIPRSTKRQKIRATLRQMAVKRQDVLLAALICGPLQPFLYDKRFELFSFHAFLP
tara:strand:+ start:775 stop:972 length:198 start_codon:yes stop_codon:yes gene_type:complete